MTSGGEFEIVAILLATYRRLSLSSSSTYVRVWTHSSLNAEGKTARLVTFPLYSYNTPQQANISGKFKGMEVNNFFNLTCLNY